MTAKQARHFTFYIVSRWHKLRKKWRTRFMAEVVSTRDWMQCSDDPTVLTPVTVKWAGKMVAEVVGKRPAFMMGKIRQIWTYEELNIFGRQYGRRDEQSELHRQRGRAPTHHQMRMR